MGAAAVGFFGPIDGSWEGSLETVLLRKICARSLVMGKVCAMIAVVVAFYGEKR